VSRLIIKLAIIGAAIFDFEHTEIKL